MVPACSLFFGGSLSSLVSANHSKRRIVENTVVLEALLFEPKLFEPNPKTLLMQCSIFSLNVQSHTFQTFGR
jgi:hypothetical protein